MEEAEDPAQVNKLRSALESVDHKRRKVNIFHKAALVDNNSFRINISIYTQKFESPVTVFRIFYQYSRIYFFFLQN